MLILSRSDTDLVELIPCVIAHCVSISNLYVTYPQKNSNSYVGWWCHGNERISQFCIGMHLILGLSGSCKLCGF